MAQTQAEYFQANATNGELTGSQMLEMLNLPEGDMSAAAAADNSGMPDAATADADNQPSKATNDPSPGEPEGAKTVILAKDGVHTIPYEKLVEAREAERSWKAQAEAAHQAAQAAQAQLAQLQAQAEQRAQSGAAPTQQEQAVAAATAALDAGEVSPEIFGDFSEEAIAKGVRALVSQQMAALKSEVLGAVQPLQAQAQQTEQQKHFQAIYGAHPDAQSVSESAELSGFIAKQPSFVRDQYQKVLAQGTATEVIELLDAFKASTGKAQPQGQGAADTAKAVIDKARQAPPSSLSDIPGGAGGGAAGLETMADLTGAELIGKFEGKTPEQIAALMEKLI